MREISREADPIFSIELFKFEKVLENIFNFPPKGTHCLRGTAHHFVNSYTLALASKSAEYTKILCKNILVCDGKPLAKYLNLVKPNSFVYMRGADFLRDSFKKMDINARHFFLGSTPQVLSALELAAKRINPKISIVGLHSPEFSDNYQQSIAEWLLLIESSDANCVWLSLGTPKQDYVANIIASRLHVKVFAVGAAFGYVAGIEREAPFILKKLYLEWFYRFFKEPLRLGRRYFWGNLIFLKIILIDLMLRLNKNIRRFFKILVSRGGR